MNLVNYYKGLGFWIIIDILLVLTLFVIAFLFFKKKNSIRLFFIFLIIIITEYLLRALSIIYNSQILLITNILINYLNIFLIVSFIIVYQADLKSIFAHVGRPISSEHYLKTYSNSDDDLMHATSEIVKASQIMAKNDIGALIIIVPTTIPQHILETGTMLNAVLSTSLLESIFNTSSPLHDGAVIISGNCVVAAGCFLPLSQDVTISKDLGTRHRAAIGISEESDVLAIVVSEETSIISTVEKGVITRYMTPEKLTQKIYTAYGINYVAKQNTRR
jgi:diadenylate cyclase